MGIAIKTENLSKLYKIGRREPYGALRDVISEGIKKIFKKNSGIHQEKYIWTLKDVSFEVKEGEIVGIIGRNGAGKTTLLKILSRITYPTEGKAVLKGKVGSMLEVGIGFHPELTGRENIYLYGTILGMKKKEIDKKFDEIVDFSGLSQFIDTPVKYYSSGMYVRLAFATAAHLQTDILLIDEVLAVGDVGFQRKCFQKMEEVRKEERTILVVSHNMEAILRFCSRAILIDKGKIIKDGNTKEVVEEYLKYFSEIHNFREWSFDEAPGSEFAKLKSVKIKDKNGNQKNSFDSREPIFVEVEYWIIKPKNIYVSIVLQNQMGVIVFIASESSSYFGRAYKILEPGLYRAVCEIPPDLLADGNYILRVVLVEMKKDSYPLFHADVHNAVGFQVFVPLAPDSPRMDYPGGYPGVVWPKFKWETYQVDKNIFA